MFEKWNILKKDKNYSKLKFKFSVEVLKQALKVEENQCGSSSERKESAGRKAEDYKAKKSVKCMLK